MAGLKLAPLEVLYTYSRIFIYACEFVQTGDGDVDLDNRFHVRDAVCICVNVTPAPRVGKR